MTFANDFQFRWIVIFVLLTAVGCSPIWGVEYYVNQDGSPHLYNAFLMSQILRGDQTVLQYFALNSISVPNSTGHWLLVFLLQIAEPFTVTKIIVTLTFAGMVASAGWLRWKTVGKDGVSVSLLIGAVLAFNWMWFLGFYNFIIGVIVFVFTVGLYYGWRGNITIWRILVLSILFLLGYWSHLVSFGMLAGTVGLLAVLHESPSRRSTILRTAVAFVPVIPLMALFRSLSESGGGFSPRWRSLGEAAGVKDWIVQILSADPFVIISRKTLPFISQSASELFVFAPIVWIAVAFACFAVFTLIKDARRLVSAEFAVFSMVFVAAMIAAAFGPDDFGLTHGGILRERILICGLFLFIPLLTPDSRSRVNWAAVGALMLVFLFQTAAIWEYAIQTNATSKEFLAAKDHIPEGKRVTSVTVVKNGMRFHAIPEPQLNTLNGIGRDIRVWDNYEIGYYLFPVVATDPSDRVFVYELTQSNAFDIFDQREDLKEKLSDLERCLANNHEKIDILVTWEETSEITAVLNKWFESEPYFSNGRVRLFRHR